MLPFHLTCLYFTPLHPLDCVGNLPQVCNQVSSVLSHVGEYCWSHVLDCPITGGYNGLQDGRHPIRPTDTCQQLPLLDSGGAKLLDGQNSNCLNWNKLQQKIQFDLRWRNGCWIRRVFISGFQRSHVHGARSGTGETTELQTTELQNAPLYSVRFTSPQHTTQHQRAPSHHGMKLLGSVG